MQGIYFTYLTGPDCDLNRLPQSNIMDKRRKFRTRFGLSITKMPRIPHVRGSSSRHYEFCNYWPSCRALFFVWFKFNLHIGPFDLSQLAPFQRQLDP